ncbi:MAG TPA: D-glycero-D-manno-heptose 1-phosphate guanosyltransferase [Bacteroidetes bacterium]|nr:D-glycero-D-manno-heptose 1-phosphate guanosyltransferase [Bacteroidota bacterium]
MNSGEAVILAGGLGTRLRKVVSNRPKVMAPVGNRPFLEYLLIFLKARRFHHVVLSVGYRHEMISRYFRSEYRGLSLEYAVEKEPLGTGGGILNAMKHCRGEDVFIMNGDTLFLIDTGKLEEFHFRNRSLLTICCKRKADTSRYGIVQIENERITGFSEKGRQKAGLINGGIYLVNRSWLTGLDLPGRFSFERDFLEPMSRQQPLYGFVSDAYFLDMGIPEDYRRAEKELPGLWDSWE